MGPQLAQCAQFADQYQMIASGQPRTAGRLAIECRALAQGDHADVLIDGELIELLAVIAQTLADLQLDHELVIAEMDEVDHGMVGEAFRHTHAQVVLRMHDVIDTFFARKALEKGADGLIAVCAGAGGHAGKLSPMALIQEIREFFDGPLALSGSIANGGAIAAALAMGADLAYMGSAFIACDEANAVEGYKDAIVKYGAEDIVYSNLFTGVHGNYLKPSIEAAGLDPANLPESDPSKMNFGSGGNTDKKAWKDIWGCGQGIGAVKKRGPVGDYVTQLEREYFDAIAKLSKPRTWGANTVAAG